MWLLPVFSQMASLALRAYYRVSVAGERVQATGPALLVANHPNSLLDPAAVVATAGRPVRFLAKAPLFRDRLVGWLVRGVGSIPVYRAQDDAAAMGANADTFRAVHEALAAGAAVGIFPEGISHTSPALAPLKTGAARIALGAAERTGGAFPIVPVGLVFRDKEYFRSQALAVVGRPVRWDDLAGRGERDREAVQELTARIDAALHTVTVNLDRWEDEPLVRAAEAVYSAEIGTDRDPAARVRRLHATAEGLARLRADERGSWRRIAREVAGHARALRLLGMTPAELRAGNSASLAAEWVARQGAFFLAGVPVAVLGLVFYYLPYRLSGMLAQRMSPTHDMRATVKLLSGIVLHAVWTALLVGIAGWWMGLGGAAAALVLLPAIGYVTLHVRDRWERATGEARRFFLRARRGKSIEELRVRQRELAARLAVLWEELRSGTPA